MKRTLLILLIAVLVLVTAIVWFANSEFTAKTEEVLMIAGLVIILAFAFIQVVSRLRSLNRNEPVEDELSKKLMVKASSLAFYISIYFWLFMMYISDKTALETHSLIGGGIMGMAIIFFLSWMGLKLFGLRNE